MPKNKSSNQNRIIWALLRWSLGLIFLWAFLDKLFGLGFAACRDAKTGAVSMMCDKAWLSGGSPTEGFLKFGTQGPFADVYQGLAGITAIDWLFMLGLLLIGVALISGTALKLASVFGSVLLFMMWTAVLPPQNHPFLDDHLVYILVLWGVYLNRDTAKWSLRSWWLRQSITKKFPILQ